MIKYIGYIGAFLIIIAILIGIFSYQGYRVYNFKKRGVVAQARIYKKYKLEKSKPQGIRSIKSSPRYSFIKKTDYYFDIGIFQGKEEKKSNFQFVKCSFKISGRTLSYLKKGDNISVIFLPDNPGSSALSFNDYNNNFYSLSNDKLSLYKQKGKTANAIVQNIDKNNSTATVTFTAYFVSDLGKYISANIPVDKSIYDIYNAGNTIEVVYLAESPQDSVIAKDMLERLIYLNPYLGVFLVILCMAVGILLLNINKNKLKNDSLPKSAENKSFINLNQ